MPLCLLRVGQDIHSESSFSKERTSVTSRPCQKIINACNISSQKLTVQAHLRLARLLDVDDVLIHYAVPAAIVCRGVQLILNHTTMGRVPVSTRLVALE